MAAPWPGNRVRGVRGKKGEEQREKRGGVINKCDKI